MSDDFCQGLARNDPKFTDLHVRVHNCTKFAAALGGNTHVRTISVVINYGDEGEDEGRDIADTTMFRWRQFCSAAQALLSLEELSIDFGSEEADEDIDFEPCEQDFVLMGLLLQHTRQIKKLVLNQGDYPGFNRMLARNLVDHPGLECFYLAGCAQNDAGDSFSLLLMVLSSIPNLKEFDLHLLNWSDVAPMPADAIYLLRFLRKQSLQSATFGHFKFGNEHAEAVADALRSRDAVLLKLKLWTCELSGDSLLSIIASSTTLRELHLGQIIILDCNEDRDAQFLAPLASNTSLKKLVIDTVQDGQNWPRFDFLRENRSLEYMAIEAYDDSPIGGESLASLFNALGTNVSLSSLDLSGQLILSTADEHLLAPLSSNKHLKALAIRVSSLDQQEFPRFDFMRQNTSLQDLYICASYLSLSADSALLSLCQALEINASLLNLNISDYFCPREEHIGQLAQMIGVNSGLKTIYLGENSFPREAYSVLLPELIRNTRLETFAIYQPDQSWLQISMSMETALFVKQLLADTRLKYIEVGPCSLEHLESLVPMVARNYCVEKLWFHQTNATSTDETRKLQETIHVITKLNKNGRGYLGDRKRGPVCKMAGVTLLSKVSDDLDCLFYHLRENPLLCDRAVAEPASPAPTVKLDRHCAISQRSSKKRRTLG